MKNLIFRETSMRGGGGQNVEGGPGHAESQGSAVHQITAVRKAINLAKEDVGMVGEGGPRRNQKLKK